MSEKSQSKPIPTVTFPGGKTYRPDPGKSSNPVEQQREMAEQIKRAGAGTTKRR